MRTVAETAVFRRYAEQIWTPAELAAFIDWIAANPLAGEVIPGSGGCRKVRGGRAGIGKRGGARVVYFNSNDGRIWLLIVYTKAKFDKLPSKFLSQLKEEVEHG
ncbi:MAG: transcriptional regulator [Betaproteobacteria bacterium]